MLTPGVTTLRTAGKPGSRKEFPMDLATIVKEAAWFGLACGVVAMGLALLYLIGKELMKPTVTVAAATPKPPFGFCLP
jgi:hypothetical protein